MIPYRRITHFFLYLSPLYEHAIYFLSYLPPLGYTWLVPILTWARTVSYRWIPYLRRRELIREIIGASFDINGRLSSWVPDDPRSRPMLMKFGDTWSDPNSEVMEWYNSQSPRSTTFCSIEHRRNKERPFYHEFLQITLSDGHKCIVERMGNGPDPHAIRWTGCPSRDIIQCLSPGEYAAWSRTRPNSERVLQLNLPRDFNLIDILAICYTMNRHVQARNYTLQRFNCYFLCCTVLSILVRRSVSWEPRITSNTWEVMVNKILGDLAQHEPTSLLSKTSSPVQSPQLHNSLSWKEWLLGYPKSSKITSHPTFEASDYSHDVIKYIAVGICSLLEPEDSASADFLLASLMSRLNENTRNNLIEGISRCLWKQRLRSSISHAIKRPIWNMAYAIKAGTAHGSKRMSALLGPVDEVTFPREPSQFTFSSIQEDVQRGFFRAFIKVCHHHIDIARARYMIEAFEGGYPRWKRVGTWIGGIIVMFLTYPAVVLFPDFILGTFGKLNKDLVILDMCATFHVSPRSMILAFPPWILAPQFQYFALGMFNPNADHTAERRRDTFDWSMHLANAWAEELAKILLHSFVCTNPPNIGGALAFLNSALPGHIWEDCLLTSVGSTMEECVRGIIDQSGERVRVWVGPDEERGSDLWSIDEFQQHLLGRIRRHAKRVDGYQFAEALVVESGIANAMTDIWASLPQDFGRA